MVEVKSLSYECSGDNGLGGVTCSSCCMIQTLFPFFSLLFIVVDLSFLQGVSSFVGVIDLSLLDQVPPFLGANFLFLVCWVERMCYSDLLYHM
jgi:hypothetical protein